MIEHYEVRFLYAAESLSYLLAAYAWWRVCGRADLNRVKFAALCTGAGFAFKFFRISAAMMLRVS